MIDEQVGRVIDELDSAGMLDNTLIVYTSDHGHMNGHHGLHCKCNSTIPQNFLDESIHVLVSVVAGEGRSGGGAPGAGRQHALPQAPRGRRR